MQATSLNKYFFPFFSILFAITLQAQGIVTLSGKTINFSVADPLFLTFFILGFFLFRRELAQNFLSFWASKYLRLLLLSCLTAFTFAFYNSDFIFWSLLKYLGFYILLGYFFLGYSLQSKLSLESVPKAFILFFNFASVLYICASILKGLKILNITINISQNAGFAHNPNIFGFLGCVALSLHLSMMFHKTYLFKNKNIDYVILFWEMASILTSGSRASWFSGLIVFLFFFFNKKSWKKLLIPFFGFLVFFGLYNLHTYKLNYSSYYSYRSPLGSRACISGSLNFNEEESLKGRISMGLWAINKFQEKPWTGHGLGFAIKESSKAQEYPYILHNTPLWLLVEFGILGTLSVLCLFIFLTRHFYRYYRKTKDPTVHAILIMLLTAAFFSLFHEIMYQRVIWFMIGWGLAITNKKAPSEEGALSQERKQS